MAYNYYQPMGYTPMFQQNTQIQPQFQPQAQASILWVDGYNEAAMYPIAPNAAVALWDKSAPAIYLKRADATGKPSLQIFDLVERKETPKREQPAEPRYATVEALERLAGIVESINGRVEEMRLKSSSATPNAEEKQL